MATIEERAEEYGKQGCGENCILICEEWKDKNGVCSRLACRAATYKSIATEQKAIDIDRIPQLYVRWVMIDGEKPSWDEYANKALEEE